ncbi:MAG TPA: GntR family transcriptional regulator [Nocardioidaceae bacterium]|nr:GntR family transcriptional regulator [Nocardioidaceae bacterium]
MAGPTAAGDSPFGSLSLEHSSTVDRVAGELRRALFDGELEPGTPLREIALAEAIGVSRSTVREALGLLVNEGVATREPNRGVFVTELDPDSVRDVCRSRAVLEIAGVRRWATASEAARDAVRRALVDFTVAAQSDASRAELTAAHLGIHRSLVGLTESQRLMSLADALSAEVRLGLAKVDRIRRNSTDQVASHRALLNLLERGDTEAAATELQHHLEHAETSMLDALHLPHST